MINLPERCDIPSPTGRYGIWVVRVDDPNADIEVIEHCSKSVFDDYKLFKIGNPEIFIIVGKVLVRKRYKTLYDEIRDVIEELNENEKGYIDSFDIFRAKDIYEKMNFSEHIISSSSTGDEYIGEDVDFLNNSTNRFPWQKSLLKKIYNESEEEFIKPDDRTIIWIEDSSGATGKSKLVKWLCINRPDETAKISFGKSHQLRTSLINAGPRICYFIDIPRTSPKDESMEELLSAIEDLKNGHITSSMYGKAGTLLMNPPHIVIFSNYPCPLKKMGMSLDRWKIFRINKETLKLRDITKVSKRSLGLY